MITEIITIGDELLLGQVIDTNSAWIAKALHHLGIEVRYISTISDDSEGIKSALNHAGKRADIVILTGGLGPTKDDITKMVLCDYFQDKLELRKDVLEHIKELFASFNKTMPEINIKQAELPSKSITLHNRIGTAPGMWFNEQDTLYISLPGVPSEVKNLMTDQVLPRLRKQTETQELVYQTVLTQGIGESSLMEFISGWEEQLTDDGLKLAWLPSYGSVRLRISGRGSERKAVLKKINDYIEKLEPLIASHFVGIEDGPIEEMVGKLLLSKEWTIGTAESCTGGLIAHKLTSIPGSSQYFQGSVVAYSNQVKETVLGVSWESLKDHGAVSKQVVEEMAAGLKHKLKVDCAIATSGVAGPDGGTKEKPVGTIWIAIATPLGVVSKKLTLGRSRMSNIKRTAETTLFLLQKEILNKH